MGKVTGYSKSLSRITDDENKAEVIEFIVEKLEKRPFFYEHTKLTYIVKWLLGGRDE